MHTPTTIKDKIKLIMKLIVSSLGVLDGNPLKLITRQPQKIITKLTTSKIMN